LKKPSCKKKSLQEGNNKNMNYLGPFFGEKVCKDNKKNNSRLWITKDTQKTLFIIYKKNNNEEINLYFRFNCKFHFNYV
jgi:hypothetical protein